MSDRLCNCTVCICIQGFMCLYLPEGCICTDSKLVFILINPVKSEIAQINCRAKCLIFHFEPEHAAQHKIRFFLIKLIGFIKALRPHILIVIKHIFLLYQYISSSYMASHLMSCSFIKAMRLSLSESSARHARPQPADIADGRGIVRPGIPHALPLISSFNGAVVVSKVMISRFFFSLTKLLSITSHLI